MFTFSEKWQEIVEWFCDKQFEANIILGFRKGFVIPERLALLLIKQKNHNKRFGQFEFEYFGDSDVVNKLFVFWFRFQ